ncbi:hypothetical protein [Tardiphaga sp. 619_E2_N8_5]|uniref:hypothetical protein n=1 Tax=unclassified Tardiphaga TaxID=2631404 RepID=UPI003F22A0E9
MGRIRTCFISSQAGADLNVLRGELSARGIAVTVPQDERALGQPIAELIRSQIQNADLVIGVMTSEKQSHWVLFELGQAAAFNRQLMLIVPPKSTIPATFNAALIVRATLYNRKAIGFALDQITAAPERKSFHRTPPQRGHSSLGLDTDRFIHDTKIATERTDPRQLERSIVEALKMSGTDIVAESTNSPDDRGFDIAVWSDGLQSFVGNPLLIEVKTRFAGPAALQQAAKRLSEAVAERGNIWGLLLYGEARFNISNIKGLPPTILISSVESLLSSLRQGSFDDAILRLRNQRVHGGDL